MSSAIQLTVLRRTILPAVLAWSFVAAAGETQLATSDAPSDKAYPSATPPSVKSDTEVQRDVLMAMVHNDVNNGSIYRNVKIIAAKGRVTLTGRVKNEKQKTKLIGIVVGVVGPANVQDQIEIK